MSASALCLLRGHKSRWRRRWEVRSAIAATANFVAAQKFEAGWGYCMRVFHPGVGLAGRRVDFLDATEEEVADLIRSMVGELAIMTCFMTMPPEQKKRVQASIASFEAYLGCPRFKN